MSQMQADTYRRASGGATSNFYANEHQCSNFVFPDETWGRGSTGGNDGVVDGFQRYIIQQGDHFYPAPELVPWLSSIESIRTLSCKYAQINDLIESQPGNVFIYGEYVVGSGNIALALCLEGLGWQRYNETSSVFVDSQSTSF